MKVLNKIKKQATAAYKAGVRWTARKQRQAALLALANIRPDASMQLSRDEDALLKAFTILQDPSRLVTRNSKIIFAAHELEDATLWQVIEARRADNAIDRIKGWCGHTPETVADLIKLSKFIEDQFKRADELEAALLPGTMGGGSKDRNVIEEAKAVLGMLQITAELARCTIEEAKNINYSDAILAIGMRHDEVEKLKRKNK